MGMEVDDLLIDLSASIADVVNSSAVYIQEDAVPTTYSQRVMLLLVTYLLVTLPNDDIASRFKVAATGEHTYAHHLLMEQSLQVLEERWYCYSLATN